MLQELVENQGDGWQSTLEELSRYFEQCAAEEKTESAASFDVPSPDRLVAGERFRQARASASACFTIRPSTWGRELPKCISRSVRNPTNPAFAPEPFDRADLQELAGGLRGHAAAVFDLLKNSLARLPDAFTEKASFLLSRRRQVLAALADLGTWT